MTDRKDELFDCAEEGAETAVFTAEVSDAGERLDVFLARVMDVSRSAAASLCEEGRVLSDGKPLTKKVKLRAGMEISVSVPAPEAVEAIPQDIPLDIRYEDDDLIVVNKPEHRQ